jgi:hypothetical protein
MTRRWLTKDRPGLLSERAPHRDRTTNSRPKLLKRKHYLVKRPQSGLDTKTYWLINWLTVNRKVTLTLAYKGQTRPLVREGAHRDRTTNSRSKFLKRKQYLVNRPQSGLDAKTYWLSAVKWLWRWQMTDPSSRQRGHPTETGQQIPDPNSWKGSNIWSNVHKVGLTPRHTDWLSAVKWLWLWQMTDPSSRQVCSTPRHTHLLTVSRKVTVTLTDAVTCPYW